MLEVTNLSRNYGAVRAVAETTFEIGKGEIVGLLGHNGAGKTTVMRMLSGSLEPDAGNVRIGGVDIAEQPQKAQAQIGYLPENLPVYPELTVVDYLEYAAQLKQIPRGNIHAEIHRAVRATDIEDKLSVRIGTLSRGYKQRVGVAQALLGSPGLLILDEPTNGLDPTQTGHMRKLIRELAKSATVILSTHIMQEVDAICSRVLILSAGQLVVDENLRALQYGNQALVVTDLPPSRAQQVLRACAGVKGVAQTETAAARIAKNAHAYRVDMNDDAQLFDVCAALAGAVASAGAVLYCLQPEQRDLETLFREVSAGGSHAA